MSSPERIVNKIVVDNSCHFYIRQTSKNRRKAYKGHSQRLFVSCLHTDVEHCRLIFSLLDYCIKKRLRTLLDQKREI